MAKGDMPNATAGIGMNPNAPGTMGRIQGMGMMGGSSPYGAPPPQAGGMGMSSIGSQQPMGSIGPSPNIMQSIMQMIGGGSGQGMMKNPGMMGAQGPMIGQGFGENTQGRFKIPSKPSQVIPRESSQG